MPVGDTPTNQKRRHTSAPNARKSIKKHPYYPSGIKAAYEGGTGAQGATHAVPASVPLLLDPIVLENQRDISQRLRPNPID